MFIFTWIRDQVRAAVLGGFEDALTELGNEAEPERDGHAIAVIRSRMIVLAPAPPATEKKKAKAA